MQFKRLFLLASVGTFALAAPVQEKPEIALARRDLPTIQKVFDGISNTIDKMVAVVEKFDGAPDQIVAVQTASDEILKIMAEGTAQISASPAMGIMDAISILGPTSSLSVKVESVVQALANKKAVFDKLSISSVVLDQLKAQRVSAEALSKVIIANLPMPSILGLIGGPVAKQITDKLDLGIKQWS